MEIRLRRSLRATRKQMRGGLAQGPKGVQLKEWLQGMNGARVGGKKIPAKAAKTNSQGTNKTLNST